MYFSKTYSWILYTAILSLAIHAYGKERQSHGYAFERWVLDHFYGAQSNEYTDKWDALPKHTSDRVPIAFRELPVSIKVVKEGQSLGLGDALRQREINHDFLLIIGVWSQNDSGKRWENIIIRSFSEKNWGKLWGPVTADHIHFFDRQIKNRSIDIKKLRSLAKKIKKQPPFDQSMIQLNPKIGSSGQRRLQCSIQAKIYETWSMPKKKKTLWNVLVPDKLLEK